MSSTSSLIRISLFLGITTVKNSTLILLKITHINMTYIKSCPKSGFDWMINFGSRCTTSIVFSKKYAPSNSTERGVCFLASAQSIMAPSHVNSLQKRISPLSTSTERKDFLVSINLRSCLKSFSKAKKTRRKYN